MLSLASAPPLDLEGLSALFHILTLISCVSLISSHRPILYIVFPFSFLTPLPSLFSLLAFHSSLHHSLAIFSFTFLFYAPSEEYKVNEVAREQGLLFVTPVSS